MLHGFSCIFCFRHSVACMRLPVTENRQPFTLETVLDENTTCWFCIYFYVTYFPCFSVSQLPTHPLLRLLVVAVVILHRCLPSSPAKSLSSCHSAECSSFSLTTLPHNSQPACHTGKRKELQICQHLFPTQVFKALNWIDLLGVLCYNEFSYSHNSHKGDHFLLHSYSHCWPSNQHSKLNYNFSCLSLNLSPIHTTFPTLTSI